MIIAQLKYEPPIPEKKRKRTAQTRNVKGVTLLPLLIYPLLDPTPKPLVFISGHTLNVLSQPTKIFTAIRRLTT